MAADKVAPDSERQAAVEKILGEPYMPDFSEEALKVRRNLLAVSLISIAGTIAGVRIAPDSPVFGFHLEHLNQAVIGKVVALVVGYMLIHFLWYVIDAFAGWRLRVTGTRVSFITAGTYGSADLDYPGDPRQSTLYNWWRSKRPAVAQLCEDLPAIEASLNKVQTSLADLQAPPGVVDNSANVLRSLGEVRQSFDRLKQAIEASKSLEESPRMLVSLRRFDGWYSFWLRSQNLRWIVLDAGLPLLLGAGALALLLIHR
jgi:hypothetical protein